MRHLLELADADAPADVLAQSEDQAGGRFVELVGFENLAQADGFAARVGDFDAHGGLAGNALDENGLGLQAEAQILAESGDAGDFYAGIGLELKRGDDRTGVDLDHAAEDVELFQFGFDSSSDLFEFEAVVAFPLGRLVEQSRGGQCPLGDGRRIGRGWRGLRTQGLDGPRRRLVLDGVNGDVGLPRRRVVEFLGKINRGRLGRHGGEPGGGGHLREQRRGRGGVGVAVGRLGIGGDVAFKPRRHEGGGNRFQLGNSPAATAARRGIRFQRGLGALGELVVPDHPPANGQHGAELQSQTPGEAIHGEAGNEVQGDQQNRAQQQQGTGLIQISQ